MNAKIITVGDELLIGQVIDTNSAWIGEQMNLQGIKIVEIQSIQDDANAIKSALAESIPKVDLILMTGGLGPTKDDITKKTIADFLGDHMVFHQETYDRIIRLFEKLKRTPTSDHREQCYMPSTATILKNKMGTAPGMWFEKDGTIIVSMPGVPYEMKYLIEQEVLPRLQPMLGDISILHSTIRTVGEGESRLAAQIEDIIAQFPANMKIAYLPSLGMVRIRLTITGQDAPYLNKQLTHFTNIISDRIKPFVYGYDKQSLQEAILELAVKHQKTVATAESCTGGLISHKLTSVPGSSAYFMGSIVAYSNELKKNILKVSDQTLHNHGAVSKETVIEMVEGTLNCVHSDIAVAVSGIAGPSGGTDTKPVGTIWIACGDKENIETVHLELSKDRMRNIEYTSTVAINMIRKFLLR